MMIGMGGMGGMGMMGGGMGMMGGGMGGGMMRSVPPADLPFAELRPKQTRDLPTRLVSLSPPDREAGLSLPARGESLRILGDVGRISDDRRVQKALKRLTAGKTATSVSQLVMWRLASNLDWDTIAQLSEKWANPFELTLARSFVEHLDELAEGESGRLLFDVTGTGTASESLANELNMSLQGKTVLGLLAEPGIPARTEGPAVGCKVVLGSSDARVQVSTTDQPAQAWVTAGKFTLPITRAQGKFDAARFADGLAEGILNRLVRTELTKGPRQNDHPTYGIRIENASPLLLNGLAVLGMTSKQDETPRLLLGMSIPPRRSMTLPVNQQMVNSLGLKKGIRVVAADLSGL
jgi:hypothetical protein